MVYWKDTIYPIFLLSVESCRYSEYTKTELDMALSVLAIRAISRFKFPKVSLEYKRDEFDEYYFVSDEVGDGEIDVIVTWMEYYWLYYQLSKEDNFNNPVHDKSVTAFSNSAIISAINKAIIEKRAAARSRETDYGKVTIDRRAAIGEIND